MSKKLVLLKLDDSTIEVWKNEADVKVYVMSLEKGDLGDFVTLKKGVVNLKDLKSYHKKHENME